MKPYLALFFSFLQIGLFSVGGGYAAMPLIQAQVVEKNAWITMSEFTDLITIAEMTPGPIAVNSATFVGNRIAGLTGGIVATVGCILPSCLIVSLLAWIYRRFRSVPVIQGVLFYLRPTVVALIASAGLTILSMVLWDGRPPTFYLPDWNLAGAGIFIVAFFLLRKGKRSPIRVMLFSGVLGIGIHLLSGL